MSSVITRMRLFIKTFKLVLFLTLVFSFSLSAQNHFVISGIITLTDPSSDVFVALVDEETNKESMGGIKSVVLKPTSNSVAFSFTNVPKGTYALKCFQDVYGNGKLDIGMFGPKEPWYLSWNRGKRFPPRWEDINFKLGSDIEFEIKLEK